MQPKPANAPACALTPSNVSTRTPEHAPAAVQRSRLSAALLAIAAICWSPPALAATPVETSADVPVRVAMVEELAETGIAQWLVDDFHELHPEIPVAVLSAMDAEALELGRQSEVDLIITHHRPSEEMFVADGWGRSRTLLMYGQFMLYGPPGDKLQLQGESDIRVALRKIADAKAPIHAAPMDTGAGLRLAELWAMSGIAPGQGDYTAIAEGSAAALAAAAEDHGYALAEVSVYLPRRRGLQNRLEPLARPLQVLRDDYSVLTVSAERAPGVREALADTFRDYLLSLRGQDRIGAFLMKGTTTNLFFPAAGDDGHLAAERGEQEAWRISLLLFATVAALIAASVAAGVFAVRWRDARRSNRRHRRIEERFALALESSGDGIWDWDRIEGQVYLSRRFREIARMKMNSHWFPAPDELWSRVLHPDDRERIRQAIETALTGDGDGKLDAQARLDPERGEPLRVAIRAVARRNHRGQRTRIVGTLSQVAAKDEAPGPS